MSDASKPSYKTKAIHGNFQSKSWDFNYHIVPPLSTSTTFRLESLERGAEGFSSYSQKQSEAKNPIWVYDRMDEPNTKMLEENLAQLESGECAVSFGSGMGAISTVFLAFLKSGQKIVAHRTLYGCTFSLITKWLPQLGVQHSLIDVNQEKELEAQLADPKTRIVYFETLSNPILEIADVEKVITAVRKANLNRKEEDQILTVVDNTFATPWALRPIEWGIDLVIESLTKNLSGFGTDMGGAVIAAKKHEIPLRVYRKDFGAIIHPYSAWHILVYGLSTQFLRFEQQQKNAQKIAEFLESDTRIENVVYPGLSSFKQKELARKYFRSPEGNFSPGTMICFRLKGDNNVCRNFVNDIAKNSHAITLAVSLGVNKTLIEVPGFMTHASMSGESQSSAGMDPRDIRLSVGLEDVNDLINDLKVALDRLQS